MSWRDAAAVEDIPPRGARVLTIGDEVIALFRTSDDRVFALRDRCPHRGGPLSQGIVHGSCVTCPLHDWVIDLTSGEARGPDEGSTPTYSTRIAGGRVQVDVPDAAASRAEAGAPYAATG